MLQEYRKSMYQEAILLAGRTQDLEQRAKVYFHIFEHSKGNHIFPLIAAHGALWGSQHFKRGTVIGEILSYQYIWDNEKRQAKMKALEAFAEAFREINRQVCIETYVAYHLSSRYGDDPNIGKYVPEELLEHLNKCHRARKRDVKLSLADQKELYQAFFLWEQNNIVGGAVEKAVAALDWPLIKYISLKPPIYFKYFKPWKRLFFRDFSNKEERIAKGMQAFEITQSVGLDKVIKSLGLYWTLPKNFYKHSIADFRILKTSLLKSHLTCANMSAILHLDHLETLE